MSKPTIKNLESELRNWKECYKGIERANEAIKAERDTLKKRISEIAAENESLRMDKKWLQQMHSAVLQSMHAFVSGRNR